MSSATGPAVTALGVAHSGKRGHDMKGKRLLAAATPDITMLAGGLGMVLWPSSASRTDVTVGRTRGRLLNQLLASQNCTPTAS